MATQNLIPKSIFCPKCGKPVKLVEVNDTPTVMKLLEAQYSQGARGECSCGAVVLFLTKPLPAEPTFTILFDVYKVEVKT